MGGVLLDLETVKRMGRLLKAYETGQLNGGRKPGTATQDQTPGTVAVRVCQVTGEANSDGTYPAKLLGRNSESYCATYADYEVIQLIEPNGATLTNGKRYVALCVGWYGGSGSASGSGSGSASALWVVAGAVPSTTLTQSVVTDVTCSGSTLTVTKKTLTIPGGSAS